MTDYQKMLKCLDPFDLKDCFIAGGAVLSRVTKTNINDWDIYPKSKDSAVDICIKLLSDGAYVVNVTDRAITFKHNNHTNLKGERSIIQVMTFGSFDSPETIFDAFDFTVCMGAYDCDNKEYFFSDYFWPDVASKTLRFNPNTKFPLASQIRVSKYREKGFFIGKGESAKIALAVSAKGIPSSWGELESQLGGVYGKSLKLQTEGVEFSLDKAFEVLSDLDSHVTISNEEDFSWVSDQEIEALIKYEPVVLYNGWQVQGETVVKFYIDDRVAKLGVEIIDRPLDECPVRFVKAYKYVKLCEGGYQGAVYSGHHNGVVYRPFEKTSYEMYPYLFSYIKPKEHTSGIQCEVKIPIEDLVEVHCDKYISKSIIMGDIE